MNAGGADEKLEPWALESSIVVKGLEVKTKNKQPVVVEPVGGEPEENSVLEVNEGYFTKEERFTVPKVTEQLNWWEFGDVKVTGDC